MISSYDKVVTMIKLLYSLLTLKCAFRHCSISKNVDVAEISKWKNEKKDAKIAKMTNLMTSLSDDDVILRSFYIARAACQTFIFHVWA